MPSREISGGMNASTPSRSKQKGSFSGASKADDGARTRDLRLGKPRTANIGVIRPSARRVEKAHRCRGYALPDPVNTEHRSNARSRRLGVRWASRAGVAPTQFVHRHF